MNIKSLLLGSAAALVAATGARAADAIVIAEPEPMEYVRICDMYGAGYFYIPGTENCLKFNGRVRYQINASSAGYGVPATKRFQKYTDYRLEVTAKNETEYGTLTSWARLSGSRTDGAVAHGVNAFINLAGFELGYHDSQWNRFLGYGGLTDGGGSYGSDPFAVHYISYSFAANGFAGFVSLDHDNNDTNYIPNVSGGLKGTFGSATVGAQVGWDERRSTVAASLWAQAKFDPITLKVIGFYSNGTNTYWDDSRWSVIAGASASLTDKAGVAVDFQWWDNTGANRWAVTGDLSYKIAPGFSALLEANYTKLATGGSSTSGFLRFERSF